MFEIEIPEKSEAEKVKDRVSSELRYLLSPLYNEIVPRLMDNFYDKYLDNYLMVGACIAEVKRIKREHKILKRRIHELEKSLQTDIREYLK